MPINARSCLKPFRIRHGLLALAPLTSLLIAAPLLSAADPNALANKEVNKRTERVADAHKLLLSGDEAYKAGKFREAVDNYSRARDLIPATPASQELRDAATERFVLASVERAKELSRTGDVAGAKDVMERVTAPGVAPKHPAALAEIAKLNDPIRTNPALTKEHTADVQEVRLLLYKAEGAYNAGKFDEAKIVYEDVLKTDPYNTAARHGLEKVAQERTNYTHAAYDDTRAEMLAQVSEAWEIKPTFTGTEPQSIYGTTANAGKVLLSQKLKTLIVPSVNLDSVTLDEAIDYLRLQASNLDTLTLDPKDKGINFVVDLGPADSPAAKQISAAKISLRLTNVPIGDVLKYINDQTRTTYTPQNFAVTIRPAGTAAGEVMTQTFAVPPDFLSAAGGASTSASSDAGADPFASDAKKPEGISAHRLTALEVLKSNGIPFPDGSSANFNAAGPTLVVTNTPDNLQMVSDLVSSLSTTAPAQVAIEVKIIRVKEVQTEELSWDWFLGEFSLGGNGIDNTLLTGGSADMSITNGNRSGNTAISGDSIDTLLANGSAGFTPPSNRAASPLKFLGLVNNTSIQAVMRGVSQKKGISLQATPSVMVRSGQAAQIQVGRELTYPTEYEPPQLPNSIDPQQIVDDQGNLVQTIAQTSTPVTPAHPTSFTKRLVGVTLDVLPTASADHSRVDLSVKPELVDFDGFVNFGTPITQSSANSITGFGDDVEVLTPNEILMPVFSTMRANTNLTVENGATIIIGGMLQEKVQKVQDHTPILGDLPLVGRFFHEDAYSPEKTAVIMLVTVHVVDPAGRPYQNN